MKKITTTAFVALALMIGFGCENKKTDTVEQAQETNEQRAEDTAMEDKMQDMSDFMTKAASGGMMEVELGNLAKEKARHAEVKKFAQMMVTDHTKANDELKALASQKNITLPTAMGDEHREHVDELRQKTGAEFDKDYMSMMVDDHKDDIDLFENAANNIDDADVKAFANKTLTVLRKHHEEAKRVNDLVKNTNGKTTTRR